MSNDAVAAAAERQADLQFTWKPEEISLDRLKGFLDKHPWVRVTDQATLLVEEWFRIQNPAMPPDHPEYYAALEAFTAEVYGSRPSREWGGWFYYPWNGVVVHCPPPAVHQTLRTARNRNLITEQEQAALAGATIVIAGMSVGSNAVAAVAATGPWHTIRIADADEISLTNLNRIRTGVHELGLPKVTSVARKIYELDPYANVEVLPEGVTADNMSLFIEGAAVIIDEMDSLPMKARLRLAAKAMRIPVVMATDNGDDSLLDIERFDLDPVSEPFHGRLSEAAVSKLLSDTLQGPEFVQAAMAIIGAEYAPVNLLRSIPEIGKSLAGVPQLGSSSLLAGGLAAYVARLIVCGQPVKSGKIPVHIEQSVRADYDTLERQRHKILAAMRGDTAHA